MAKQPGDPNRRELYKGRRKLKKKTEKTKKVSKAATVRYMNEQKKQRRKKRLNKESTSRDNLSLNKNSRITALKTEKQNKTSNTAKNGNSSNNETKSKVFSVTTLISGMRSGKKPEEIEQDYEIEEKVDEVKQQFLETIEDSVKNQQEQGKKDRIIHSHQYEDDFDEYDDLEEYIIERDRNKRKGKAKKNKKKSSSIYVNDEDIYDNNRKRGKKYKRVVSGAIETEALKSKKGNIKLNADIKKKGNPYQTLLGEDEPYYSSQNDDLDEEDIEELQDDNANNSNNEFLGNRQNANPDMNPNINPNVNQDDQDSNQSIDNGNNDGFIDLNHPFDSEDHGSSGSSLNSNNGKNINDTERKEGLDVQRDTPGISAGIPFVNRNNYSDDNSSRQRRQQDRMEEVRNEAENARRAQGMARRGGGARRSALSGIGRRLFSGSKAKVTFRFLGPAITMFVSILLLMTIIGGLAFIVNMPGIVLDNLKMEAEGFFLKLRGYWEGKDKAIPIEEINNLAQYLEDTGGHDLVYWGFAKTYEKDVNGRVNKVETKYLPVYLAAEQRCYMVVNSTDTISAFSLFGGVAEVLKTFSFKDVNFGTGMLHIEENGQELLKIRETSEGSNKTTLKNKVKVFRREKEMIITANGDIQDDYNANNGIDVYRFKLKYWLEKYMTPLDFYISLHYATRAPEFVVAIAENPGQDDGMKSESGKNLNTQIDINIAVLKPDEDYELDIVYLDIDPETQQIRKDENGMPKVLEMPEIKQKFENARSNNEDNNYSKNVPGFPGMNYNDLQYMIETAEKFNQKDFMIFTPYITKVVNHWYYKQILFQGTPDENTASEFHRGQAINVYRVEELPEGAPGRVRYQLYSSIQVPELTNENNENSDNENSENQNSENQNSENQNNEVENANNENNTSEGGVVEDSGIEFNPYVNNKDDDRRQMEELSHYTGPDGISGSESIFGSLFGLIRSASSILKALNVNTGILDTATQILGNIDSAYSTLAGVVNRGVSSSTLNGIASGLTRNVGSGLNLGSITSSLGLGNLNNVLNTNNLMGSLGLNKINNSVLDISNLTNINQLSSTLSSQFNMSQLTGSFGNLSSVVKNSINPSSIANAMYAGLSSQIKSDLGREILNYARNTFGRIDPDDISSVANNIINSLASDLTNRTTSQFFNNLRSGLLNEFTGKYNNQMRELLENESARQLTGLTINQLNGISDLNHTQITNLGNQMSEVSVNTNAAYMLAREISNYVNTVSKTYTSVDTSTTYALTNIIKQATSELDNANIQLNNLSTMLQSTQVSSTFSSQVGTIIENSNSSIGIMKDALQTLDVERAKRHADYIIANANQLDRIVESVRNFGISAQIITQGSRAALVLKAAGDRVNVIDKYTIEKFKDLNRNIKLDNFQNLSNELSSIDPKTNGLLEKIGQMNDKLSYINSANISNISSDISRSISKIDSIVWLTTAEKTELKTKYNELLNYFSNINTQISNLDNQALTRIANIAEDMSPSAFRRLSEQISKFPNTSISQLIDVAKQVPQNKIEELGQEFAGKLADAVIDEIKSKLAENIAGSLKQELNRNGELNGILARGTEDTDGEEDQPIEAPEDEYLTGFYIRETRKRDYMQKSEPLLIPYSFEHWAKLFVDNKYLIAGTDTYLMLKEKYPNSNLFDDEKIVNQYGQSIWEAADGTLEEGIYARLQSIDSVDSEYLLRYFKELFNMYGERLSEYAKTKKDIGSVRRERQTIGWIFKTEEKQEIINTDTGQTRTVHKAIYEPVDWSNSNTGTLYSEKNQPLYGFKKDLEIVSPIEAVVVSKTEVNKNEFGEDITASVVLKIKSSNENIDGMLLIIKGGEFTVSEGQTVSKDTVIGKTTDDDILIALLRKDTRALVDDISEYIYPPYLTEEAYIDVNF